jgi:16S rRNA G966 N2-methylase RsmD
MHPTIYPDDCAPHADLICRGEGEEFMIDLAERVLRAYEHKTGWVNRLILGDSLVVINSLLKYEGLGGQVQCIYVDPPYGVKFGSNFQPDKTNAYFRNQTTGTMLNVTDLTKVTTTRIIGNITDNPELLEAQNEK